MLIHFAADLHLSPATPGIARLFLDYLAGPARQADALYLLGDLFEYWAGDDDLAEPFNSGIADALAGLTAHGVAVNFIAGNRDFLIGEGFAAATGVKLLADPQVLTLANGQFILSHGDALCTGDLPYQAFRAQVRQPAWQAVFLALPLAERKRQIMAVRAQSEAGKKAAYDPALMDVAANATDDLLRQHGYATLIHGHTHRPATHTHIVDGITCERWVLADWHEEPAARGEVLAWDGESLCRIPLSGAGR